MKKLVRNMPEWTSSKWFGYGLAVLIASLLFLILVATRPNKLPRHDLADNLRGVPRLELDGKSYGAGYDAGPGLKIYKVKSGYYISLKEDLAPKSIWHLECQSQKMSQLNQESDSFVDEYQLSVEGQRFWLPKGLKYGLADGEFYTFSCDISDRHHKQIGAISAPSDWKNDPKTKKIIGIDCDSEDHCLKPR